MSIVSKVPPEINSSNFLYGNNPIYRSHTTDPNNEDRYIEIKIGGFAGRDIGFYEANKKYFPFPHNIAGNLPILKGDYYITHNNRFGIEYGDLYVGGPQILKIEDRTFKFLVGKYNFLKLNTGKYRLINDSNDSLRKLIVPVSVGGKRKRHTKRRKTNKRTRRRRSIRT